MLGLQGRSLPWLLYAALRNHFPNGRPTWTSTRAGEGASRRRDATTVGRSVVSWGVASAMASLCVFCLSPPTLRVRSELVCRFGSVIASRMLCETVNKNAAIGIAM